MVTEAPVWFDRPAAESVPCVDYAERARFYEVEYRTDIDRPFLRSLLTPEVRSVLEIPCGAGRNLDWLADSGRQVVCADIEPAMVERVRERITAAGAGERVSAVIADLCELDLGRRFDLILVPQEAFQLLAEPGQAERALHRLAQHLTRDGTLLLDLHTFRADRPGVRSPLPDYFDPAVPAGELTVEWTRPVDGRRWLSRARRQHDEGTAVRVEYHYQLGAGNRLISSWQSEIRLRRHTLGELRSLAAHAGLRVTQVASGYDGTPHTPGAARLVTLLRPADHPEQNMTPPPTVPIGTRPATTTDLDPDALAYFRRYFTEYFRDEFRPGQGTEDILDTLAGVSRAGDWLDLGAGPCTLFWSIPLTGVRSIRCADAAPEALAVLRDFVDGDDIPLCYQQVLDRHQRDRRHLDRMRKAVADYAVFDAMKPWPGPFGGMRFDLITEFGLFGLSPDPDHYRACFSHLRDRLRDGGTVVGADWIRSARFIADEGHDNSYLSERLVARATEEAGLTLRTCRLCPIQGDELYDALVVWSADKPDGEAGAS